MFCCFHMDFIWTSVQVTVRDLVLSFVLFLLYFFSVCDKAQKRKKIWWAEDKLLGQQTNYLSIFLLPLSRIHKPAGWSDIYAGSWSADFHCLAPVSLASVLEPTEPNLDPVLVMVVGCVAGGDVVSGRVCS